MRSSPTPAGGPERRWREIRRGTREYCIAKPAVAADEAHVLEELGERDRILGEQTVNMPTGSTRDRP
jgi:hypothetical protein